MLEKKWIKKIGFWGQKGSTSQGYAQPAQPVEEPVEGYTKISLSPNGLFFPVKMILFPVEVILFPVEAMVTCQALNAPTASESIDP